MQVFTRPHALFGSRAALITCLTMLWSLTSSQASDSSSCEQVPNDKTESVLDVVQMLEVSSKPRLDLRRKFLSEALQIVNEKDMQHLENLDAEVVCDFLYDSRELHLQTLILSLACKSRRFAGQLESSIDPTKISPGSKALRLCYVSLFADYLPPHILSATEEKSVAKQHLAHRLTMHDISCIDLQCLPLIYWLAYSGEQSGNDACRQSLAYMSQEMSVEDLDALRRFLFESTE